MRSGVLFRLVVKLKLSLALNVALLALVAFLLIRNELSEADGASVDRYVAGKKREVFDTRGVPLPPERFDYRLETPNQPPPTGSTSLPQAR